MEAMACGVPVISTKVGWAADYAEHGKNIWFVGHDISEIELSKVIRKIYDDKELRDKLRNNALELIKNFSLNIYCERMMELYKKICLEEQNTT